LKGLDETGRDWTGLEGTGRDLTVLDETWSLDETERDRTRPYETGQEWTRLDKTSKNTTRNQKTLKNYFYYLSFSAQKWELLPLFPYEDYGEIYKVFMAAKNKVTFYRRQHS
jgi:hypothetical protein